MRCKQRQGRQVQRWVNNLRGEETEISPLAASVRTRLL